ncbi:hypothetical protein JCM11641_006602 [Rhodosporidiobolus odoratus]
MASYSSAQFDKAVKLVGELPKDGPVQPSVDDKLHFYSNFKVATVGENTTTRPGMLDFAGKAKWDAWTKLKGKDAETAKSDYVARFLELLEKDDSETSKGFKADILGA